MALIRLAKPNCKFIIYSLIYLTLMLLLNGLSFIPENSNKNMKAYTKKIPFMVLINHIFLLLCVIKKLFENNEKKQKGEQNDENNLIFNKPEDDLKVVTTKDNILLLVTLTFDCAYNVSLMIDQKHFEDKTESVISQYYKFLDVLILLIFFQCSKKINLDKHQYFSLAIIIISGLGKFLINFFFNKKLDGFKPILIFFLFFCPFSDSLKLYLYKRFLTDKKLSPFSIGFIVGLFYFFICSISLAIFSFVNTKVDFMQTYFSMKGLEGPTFLEFLLLLGYSLLNSAGYLWEFIILEKFSPFHIVLLATLGDLITDCFIYFKNYPNFNTTELVVRIILYVFEILGILIFIETIILNCCGLERNVFLNITERGKEEANKIIKNVEEIDDSRKASELSVFSEETNNNEENKNDNEILH